MPSRIQCPACENAYAYSPALLGKTVRCRQCQHTFTITAPPPVDPAVPTAPVGPDTATPALVAQPTPAPKSGPPPLPPRPAGDQGGKPGLSRRRDAEPDEDDDRPPVADRVRGDDRAVRSRRARDEDEGDRPARRRRDRDRQRPGPRPAAPEHPSSPLLLLGLIAAFVFGFLVIAAGIAYLLWPSSTPSSTHNNSTPAAASDPMLAADAPKGLDEIIKEAPNRKEEVAGPPPERPKFDVPRFDPPDVKRGPRGGGPNPPGIDPPRFDIPRFEPPAGFPGGPDDPPKPRLPAPKFLTVEALPITPAPMATNHVERAMPGPVESVVVAGGGRLLLLHLPRERRVAVFDVSKGERVKLIPAEDAGARVAGGMNLFVIYLPGKGVLERWSTKTLEREAELKAEFPPDVTALAMGSASNGPLVAALRGGDRRAVHGGATVGYFDPATGKEVGYELGGDQNPFGMALHDAKALVLRVSADGSVVTGFGGGPGPEVHVIDGGRVTRYWKHIGPNQALPGPDGRTLYGIGNRYPADLKVEDGPREDLNNPNWLIPAVQGDFFLSLRPQAADRRAPFGQARKAVAEVCMGAEGKSVLNLGELPNFEVPTGFFEARGKTFDQQLVLVPDAKVLAVVPTKNKERLVLVRADLDAALSKAGFDYLFVTSRPPTVAVKGEAYKYAMAVRSKKGGVKVTLESGPKGMTANPAGAVAWDVPKDFAEAEVGVILKVADAGGKEVFHAFRLAVRGKDDKPAEPKGK
jgi:hypothetical protein